MCAIFISQMQYTTSNHDEKHFVTVLSSLQSTG